MLIFITTLGTFYKTQWAWLDTLSNNPIDVNFHLQKSLEIFDKNKAYKIRSKNDKEIKISPLMPIRVKGYCIASLDIYLGSIWVQIG